MAQPKLAFSGYNKLKQSKYGPMLFNRNDMYVGRSFDLYGEFSDLETQELLNYITRESWVMDIGANIGALTVPFAKRAAKVFAIEPQKEVFKLLAANTALNSLENVHLYECAVGSYNGFINIPYLDPNSVNNFGGLELDAPRDNEYEVTLQALDSLFERIERVDFMKIDVEGMELEVLKGARDLINEFKPVMYIENDRADKSRALLDYLHHELGYSTIVHNPPLFNPNNFYNNKENVFPNLVSINILCKPCD